MKSVLNTQIFYFVSNFVRNSCSPDFKIFIAEFRRTPTRELGRFTAGHSQLCVCSKPIFVVGFELKKEKKSSFSSIYRLSLSFMSCLSLFVRSLASILKPSFAKKTDCWNRVPRSISATVFGVSTTKVTVIRNRSPFFVRFHCWRLPAGAFLPNNSFPKLVLNQNRFHGNCFLVLAPLHFASLRCLISLLFLPWLTLLLLIFYSTLY